MPPRAKDTAAFEPSIPGSLEDAMLYFLACCAARRMRGQVGKHMSMLIHTSARVKMHDRVAERIKAWIDESREDLSSGKGNLAERMSWLQNDRIKLGVDLDLGGAITFLASMKDGSNVINNFDLGRQVQLSFYGGPVPFEAKGQKPAEHSSEA